MSTQIDRDGTAWLKKADKIVTLTKQIDELRKDMDSLSEKWGENILDKVVSELREKKAARQAEDA